MLEIVEWHDKRFHEIQEQDNPAFGEDECVMICLQSRGYCGIPLPGNHVVLLIRDQMHDGRVVERVQQRGIFHNIDDARMFAEALAAMEADNG